jgi:hypothetical protein
MSSGTETVPTFDDLKRQIAPELEIVHKRQRNRLVREIVRLAKRKLAADTHSQFSEDQVGDIRGSIANHKKMLTCILNAIKEIDAAKKIGEVEDRTILKHYQVLEARFLLQEAAKDIAWVKDHMFPGMIPPKLRNSKDRKTRFPLQSEKVNRSHWFIRELNTRLNDFVDPHGQTLKFGRDRLITKVLGVAFDEHLSEKTIERVRNRKA